jgi:2-keto-4-pentenoate hydratase/2-oxohepta-3-ene-1,7-dioic acid hydratase in catechol pathway
MTSTTNPIILKAGDIGTIYCVGRNYAAHAKELNNPIPKSPLIFTKTRATLCSIEGDIQVPADLGRCDHETEIAVMLGQDLYQATEQQALDAVSHIGMALDLTLREKQTQLKQKGHPWTLAKNFINASPVSALQPVTAHTDLTNIDFSLTINDRLQQQGNSRDMLFTIVDLVVFLSHQMPLHQGDLILTGTPEGVGPLVDQDQITLSMNGVTVAQARICRN